MSEQRYEVRAFELDYACDHPRCGGFMRPDGRHLLSNPPQFPHECYVCGARKTFTVKYPTLAYRRVDAEAQS
jgi:hypothetical protein